MTVSLITDGMLQNCCNWGGLRAPDNIEALMGDIPTIPCIVFAEDPAKTMPITPLQTKAAGPAVPSVPCGTTANDPAIDPPIVPEAVEANEELGTETPATPRCPEGYES